MAEFSSSNEFKALIVEFDGENLEALETTVNSLGHLCVKASSQKKALELLTQQEFDYFVMNQLIPYSNGKKPRSQYCLNLIDKIRDYYPETLKYPIIIFHNSAIDYEEFRDATEYGANTFLSFYANNAKDETYLSKTIKRLTDKASLKRRVPRLTVSEKKADLAETSLSKKLSLKYKLVVDLKTNELYFKGVLFPSGVGGLQNRHTTFLFALARNPKIAMDQEELKEKINDLGLVVYGDPSKNLRSQIRKTLRVMSKANPTLISEHEVKLFLQTSPKDRTCLFLDRNDIFTIYGDEEYPP